MVCKGKGSMHRALHHPRHNFALPEDPAPVFVLLSHACTQHSQAKETW